MAICLHRSNASIQGDELERSKLFAVCESCWCFKRIVKYSRIVIQQNRTGNRFPNCETGKSRTIDVESQNFQDPEVVGELTMTPNAGFHADPQMLTHYRFQRVGETEINRIPYYPTTVHASLAQPPQSYLAHNSKETITSFTNTF